MSDAQNQGEPTMEEILASIRKIISEDGTPEGAEAADEAAAPEEAAAADSPAEAAEEAPAEAPAAEAEAPAAAEGDDEDDDVLDLTRMVGEDGAVEDLAEADEEPPAAAAPELEEEFDAPADLAEEADDAGAEIPDLIAVDEATAPALAPAADDGSLLADTTQAAVTATLTSVAATAGPAGGMGLTTDGGKPLEILVREVLEPYLKSWLDENLAGLVERIVRDEVQKMARRAEYR